MNGPGTLIACGILKNEIKLLAAKQQWNSILRFLDSSLHVDFDKLYSALEGSLRKELRKPVVVVYGTCHPHMDTLLQRYGANWFCRQNCIEMLLGQREFSSHLEAGAFFLLEDWARQWERVTTMALGQNEKEIQHLFRSEHKYLLCIRTPCSGDFTGQAAEISRKTSLPMRWLDISLEEFESYLLTLFQTVGKQVDL